MNTLRRIVLAALLLLPLLGALQTAPARSDAFNDRLIVVHYYASW